MDGVATDTMHQANHDSRSMPPSDAGLPDYTERRKHVREKVLKAAKIIFGGGDSVYNCLVLDESPDGIFVDLGGIVALPPEVTVQFSTGATFRAIRRWRTGSRVGFEFTGQQIVSHETSKRMNAVVEILHDHGLPAAMQTLRVAQFFDNIELRRVAEAAEAAHRRLEQMLGRNQANPAWVAEA